MHQLHNTTVQNGYWHYTISVLKRWWVAWLLLKAHHVEYCMIIVLFNWTKMIMTEFARFPRRRFHNLNLCAVRKFILHYSKFRWCLLTFLGCKLQRSTWSTCEWQQSWMGSIGWKSDARLWKAFGTGLLSPFLRDIILMQVLCWVS